jgi:phage terminase large subunit-like protein
MAQGRGGFRRAPDADDFLDLVGEAAAAIFTEEEWARFVDRLTSPERRRLYDALRFVPHDGQEPPKGAWRTWAIVAGRGFGKTRAGAEWVWSEVRRAEAAALLGAEEGAGAGDGRPLSIALVGGSADEVAKVMVEGPSGLLATARTGEEACWVPTRGVVLLPGGAEAFVYSAEAPEKLRGPEHHLAWCDELAKWRRADAVWDNLQLGLRLGAAPRALVTTTPRPVAALRRVLALDGTVETGGRTADNPHLPAAFRAAVEGVYGGTRLGRQELDGILFDDVEHALWPRELIEASRSGTSSREFRRVVVGVDPPASAHGDACGIVVCGLGQDGLGYVLADHSAAGCSPEGWARKVAAAAEAWGAHRVVAEANNGGAMVESVLRAASVSLPVKLVHAADGKAARAEPVAALFEGGRAKLAGVFPELEDELAGLTLAGGYEGPGMGSHRSGTSMGSRSPDRADAMVYALAELMLGPVRGEPRIRAL